MVAVVLFTSAAAHATTVAVVTSDGLETYKQAVAAFAAQIPDAEIARFDLGGDAKRADAIVDAIRARKPSLVFALGPLAANTVHRGLKDLPLVFALVPNYEKYGLDKGNATGIALTRPVDDQLASIHDLLPNAKRVGVLYTPELNQEAVTQAMAGAHSHGLELVAEKLTGSADVAESAQRLASRCDAIWMLADRGIATMEASTAISEAARKAHLPLVALTEGQVREGALLAFTTSPSAIGAQAGKLVARIVTEKIDVSALAVTPPGGLELWLNTTTLKALPLDPTWTTHLLEHAAQKGLSVRATP